MINLFVNYYKDKYPERQKEIDFCLAKNLAHKNLNVILIESQNRLTFNDYFACANKITGPNDVNIVANSDIYFDDTIILTKHLKSKEFWGLARYDLQADGSSKFFDRPDSQDVFLWLGKININCNYCLGYRGIDNRILYEAQRAGYKVSNPSLSIKSYHLHLTGIRNYDYSPQFLVPPPYLTVYPSKLE